jgi:hypothetical protein
MNRKGFLVLMAVLLFMGGIAAVSAQDLIILRDGNVIESNVTETSPTEIRYKRSNHLDGPTIVVPAANVLSIRYANGKVDIINAAPTAPAGTAARPPAQSAPAASAGNTALPGAAQTAVAIAGAAGLPGGDISSLQAALNRLPAIPIAGKTLKFIFSGETWRAQVNGADTLSGTLTFQAAEAAEGGGVITLKPTHAYLRGRQIPTPSVDMFLEYQAGPPMSLRAMSKSEVAASGVSSGSAIVLSNDDWQTNQDSGCTAQASVNRETIDGEEKDVLTLNARIKQGGWANTFTMNDTIAEQLRGASGVRLKALGDGKKWFLIMGMPETRSIGNTHRVAFTTKKGKVVEIDIPFSKLRQDWGIRVKFNRDSIVSLEIEKNYMHGAGASTVKIFDIETY